MGVTTREVYTVYNRASSTVGFCDRPVKSGGCEGGYRVCAIESALAQSHYSRSSSCLNPPAPPITRPPSAGSRCQERRILRP